MSNYSMRRFKDRLALWLGALCAVLAMIPLVSILYEVVKNGASTINVDFLTAAPGVIGQPGGGIGPAIQGTLILVELTIIIGVPLGVLSGIYLSEFGDNPVGRIIRFLNDVLAEFPSVVIGVVIFTLIVLTLRSFSVVAGAFALSVIMLPVVTRSTEESLKLVPNSIRDASMALGIRRWRKCPASLHHSGKPVFLLRPKRRNGCSSASNLPVGVAALSLCAGARVGSGTGANTHGLGRQHRSAIGD